MHLLILAVDYPDLNGGVASFFIHTRNIEYVKNDIDITVLSFKSKNRYTIDGIDVITEEYYREKLNSYKFDILLVHAPNLRNHYRFIRKHNENFNKIIFFFHGHEVLVKSEVYPKEYIYLIKKIKKNVFINNVYDKLKLILWKKYFHQNANRISLIFVSKWMKSMFFRYIKLDEELFKNKNYIIYNSVGEEFFNNHYQYDSIKIFDFITIRNNLDGSKYGIDIVKQLAIDNPNKKFCVIGKGNFFHYYDKPQNLELIEKGLSHIEVISYLNKSKYALMPTRADAQGVMSCEIATFGIPLITSSIDVCKEVFEGFTNVSYIDNNIKEIDIEEVIKKMPPTKLISKNYKYSKNNTIHKEIQLFKNLLNV